VGRSALLSDIARTADVVALTETTMYALDREPFIEAVTGHAASIAAASVVIDERLQNE
jgi:CRP-like cAMP-binding protein